jgi:hypothetical protein
MRQEQNQRRYCIKKEPLHNSSFSIEEDTRPETGNDANKGDGRMAFGLQAGLAEKQVNECG